MATSWNRALLYLWRSPAPGRNAARGLPSQRGGPEVSGEEGEEEEEEEATTLTAVTTRGTTTTNYYIPNIYTSALRDAHLPLIPLI